MILTNFRSSSWFFHSESGKGFMKLGLGRTFSDFNELLKCADRFYCRVTCSCLCFQYLPPPRATGFQFEEVSPVPSALSVIGFFPPKGCAAFGHVLTKHLFLTSFWLNIFEVFLLEGPVPWSSYRNGIRQQQTWVRLFHMSTQAVLHTLLYWRTLFYVFPLLFILVEWTSFSLSKIHAH